MDKVCWCGIPETDAWLEGLITAGSKPIAFSRRYQQRTGCSALHALRMGLDHCSQARADKLFNADKPFAAINQVGSLCRFEYARRHLPRGILLEHLPYLWCTSDPDDTRKLYRRLWRDWAESRRVNKLPLWDIQPLPPDQKAFLAYRGQSLNAPLGCSWTLDYETAKRFAEMAAFIQPYQGRVVYRAVFKRPDILAYLTQRSEQEIIVAPKPSLTKEIVDGK